MSWWDFGEEDVMGDRPIDLIEEALKTIASDCEVHGMPKPTLEEILKFFSLIIKRRSRELFADDKGNDFQKIIAKVDSHPDIEIIDPVEAMDDRFLTIVDCALIEVAKLYEERWERKIRLRELLGCITFVLGYKPENYLSNAMGLLINKIIAV